jgi:outer membrane protein TolC
MLAGPRLAVLLLSVAHAAADPRGAANGPADLDSAVAGALENNPAVRAARERAAAAAERPAREGALPNPRAAYMGMNEARSPDPVDAPERRIEVEQMLPGPGKRGLRAGAARAEAESMGIEVEALEADLAMDVRETVYELQGVRAAAEFLRMEMEVAGRMGNVTATRVGTGRAGQADLVMAEGERTMLALRLPDVEARVAALEERLCRLLGRDAGAPPVLATARAPSTLPWSLDALLDRAAERPEVRRAASETRRMGLERDLMRREGRPDYRVGLEYRSLESESDMAMLKVGIDLPVWRRAVGAGVREAEHRVRAGESEAADASRRAAEEVREAHARWRAAVRARDLVATEAMPQAERRRTAIEADYRAGQSSFLAVLDAERSLLQARRMLAMTDSEAGMAAARLVRAAGLDPRTPWPAPAAVPPAEELAP